MDRSHGPDRLKSGYACYSHHNGDRSFSGISNESIGSGNYKSLMDYNCCCNPCLYYKSNFHIDGNWDDNSRDPNKEHCCNCNPKALIAIWAPDNPEDLCDVYTQKEPLFFDAYPVDDGGLDGNLSVRYAGLIAGHQVVVTLSPFKVYPDGSFEIDGSGCRWTVHLANNESFLDGYSTQISFIDHHNVTCLGVPNFSFSGVYGYGGDGGTVTIRNYDSSTVAFKGRYLDYEPLSLQSNINYLLESGAGIPSYGHIYASSIIDPPVSGSLVPLPTSIITPPVMLSGYNGFAGQYPTGTIPLVSECKYVPRTLCVKSDRVYEIPNPGDYLKYREYIYDTGFYPIERAEFHPDYTGIENFTTGKVLARWRYTPLNYGGEDQVPADENKRFLFLYETYTHNIPLFSGDRNLAQESGSPRYLLIPIEHGLNPNTPADNVWPGGGFYYHPLIHGGSGIIRYITDSEEYYHDPNLETNLTRNMYLGGNETYSKIVYGSGYSCTCDISTFSSYDDDEAIGELTVGFADIRFIKSGRCSKWEYYCSDACRCVPREICMYTAEVLRNPASTNLIKYKLTWDGISCWTTGYGDTEIKLCLKSKNEIGFLGEETYNGLCGLSLTGGFFASGANYNYVFNDIYPLSCSWLALQKSAHSNIVESGITVASMIVSTFPTFGDCDARTSCDLASPCNKNCGSHPDSINIYARVYSVPGEDEQSGGYTPSGTCEENFTLYYKEDIVISEEDPITYYTICYYEGYYPCASSIVPIRAYLNGDGSFPFIEFDNNAYDLALYSPYSKNIAFDSYTESCEPYFFSGIIREFEPYSPFWWKRPCNIENDSCFGFRMEIVITEA